MLRINVNGKSHLMKFRHKSPLCLVTFTTGLLPGQKKVDLSLK